MTTTLRRTTDDAHHVHIIRRPLPADVRRATGIRARFDYETRIDGVGGDFQFSARDAMLYAGAWLDELRGEPVKQRRIVKRPFARGISVDGRSVAVRKIRYSRRDRLEAYVDGARLPEWQPIVDDVEDRPRYSRDEAVGWVLMCLAVMRLGRSQDWAFPSSRTLRELGRDLAAGRLDLREAIERAARTVLRISGRAA